MIVKERFVFWDDIQTLEQFQILNSSQLNVKNIDRQSQLVRKKQKLWKIIYLKMLLWKDSIRESNERGRN